MRIDLHYGPQQAPEPRRNNADAGSAANSATRAPADDHAQLSGAHVQVAALAAQASQLPEVRQERVQALRQAVESGLYHPDPKKVAQALAAHMMSESAA